MYEKLKCPNFTRFLPQKLSKYPKFYDICPKSNKIPVFYTIFARKMPEFYIIIVQKIFFPDFFFGGGRVPSCPHLLRLSLTAILLFTQVIQWSHTG